MASILFRPQCNDIMAANALESCIARSPARMVETQQDKLDLFFYEEGFQVHFQLIVAFQVLQDDGKSKEYIYVY